MCFHSKGDLIKDTLIDFKTQTPYSHKLKMSTRSTFKLCYKNEVLWQIMILDIGNPFKFSVTGHPVLAGCPVRFLGFDVIYLRFGII